MTYFTEAWARCSVPTRLSILSAVVAMQNVWLGAVLALASTWIYTREHPFNLKTTLPLLYWGPVFAGLVYLIEGLSLPPDDLLRHLTAWKIGLDYRPQYPWSNLPAANLWLGFDYTVGLLQRLGLSQYFLLKWLPGVAILLQSLVIYLAFKRMTPARHLNPAIFLIFGAMALLLLTPRALLSRPEIFVMVLAGFAAVTRSGLQAAAWCLLYVLTIPMYWLGWVYAPIALLLSPKVLCLKSRLVIGLGLGLLHLIFWHFYTGDYLGLMLWLRETLTIVAFENEPVFHIFKLWPAWLFVVALVFALSTLNKRRAIRNAPYLLLLAWFSLPNQVRYFNVMVFFLLPWVYHTITLVARSYRAKIPPVLVFIALAIAAMMSVASVTPQARFALGADAKVYSQSAYSTVFYGEPGIQVEPSFALGASKPEWENLLQKGKADCSRLLKGGFTHVIEHNLIAPLECGQVIAIQGEWRLWKLASPQ